MDKASSNGQAAAGGLVLAEVPGLESIAVCCSGGGIRSAAFNLGALQMLQRSALYERVTTVAAVSGGSYIAAGHALTAHRLTLPPADGNAKDDAGSAEAGTAEAGTAVPAYAPRSPEEQHLRDHTRYLLPSWPVSAFGVLGLLLGLVVNLVLVGACLWIGGRLLGVLLRASGILSGLGTEDPRLQLTYAGLGCAVLAGAGILVSWWAYLRDRIPAGGMGRQQRPRALTVSWRLLATATVGALLLVATPAAVAGLYHLGRCEGGDLATVVRWLGFGNHVGCPGVAAGPGTGASLAGNVAGMAAVLTALVGVIRTAVGKVRTYRKDLADQSWLTKGLSAGGRFVRDRLAPWAGTALVVVLAVYFGLRLVASAAASGPDWWWQQPLLAGFAFLVIVLVKALVDINHTSLHRYYRDRLAAAYAFDRTRAGTDVDRARLSELTKAKPELVICAAANCTDREQKNVPPGRGAVSFTFTPTSVGLSVSPQVDAPEITPVTGTATGGGRTRRVRTESYEDCVPGFGLFDAVAVSGAAVAPVMGKMTQPTKRILFALGNVRLGVWLPSPHLVAGLDAPRSDERRKARRAVRRRLLQPDLQRLWAEAAGTLHIDGKWMYVTDGGHYDNLGLVEALRRRPGAIVVFDASGDAQGSFSTLGQAVALARTECGCDIGISPDPISPDQTSRLVPTTVAVGSVRYPGEDQRPRPLLYARLGVTAAHPWDVQAYLRDHPSFPTASTIQQLYDADEFEAYRAMGEATTADLLKADLAKVLPSSVTASHSS